MKKFFFITIALLALAFNGFSQGSDVTVFSQDGEKFWVIINGIRQNDAPMTNVKVTGLTGPNYKFKIIFEDANIPDIDKNIFTKDSDGNFFKMTYSVRRDRKGTFVLSLNSYDQSDQVSSGGQYVTPLNLQETPSNTQTNTQTSNQVTTNQTTTTVNTSTNTNPNGDGGSVSVNAVDPVTGEVINMNLSVNGTGTTGTTGTTTTTTTTTTVVTSGTGTNNTNQTQMNLQTGTNQNQTQNQVQTQSTHYNMPGYNGPMGCYWPMSDGDFQSALGSIKSKTFEDSKLTVAKQITGSNCLLCSQVKEIMLAFTFETTKLEFAKFAYSRVFDQGNYYKLNDAFTFESSIDELNDYIQGKH